ncbi:hypothetical protein WN51_13005, partial [Melipona quadrifasciata]
CAYTGSCKCDAYVILVWPVTSSVLPMTFTATTPCSCSSGVHPRQASTSLIIKDSTDEPIIHLSQFQFHDRRHFAGDIYFSKVRLSLTRSQTTDFRGIIFRFSLFPM